MLENVLDIVAVLSFLALTCADVASVLLGPPSQRYSTSAHAAHADALASSGCGAVFQYWVFSTAGEQYKLSSLFNCVWGIVATIVTVAILPVIRPQRRSVSRSGWYFAVVCLVRCFLCLFPRVILSAD